MSRLTINLAAFLVSVEVLAASVSAGASERPAELILKPGWNRVVAATGTGCIDGGEYAFYVRRGDPNRLTIMFMGGGPCWSGTSCDTCGEEGDRHRITPSEPTPTGLLDLTNRRNPIRGHTIVFIPNCTRDVHLGARVVPYSAPPNSCRSDSVLTIRHIGNANASAALQWIFAHLPRPKLVLVTGQSAGAIASPFYVIPIAQRFPRARIVQLGDAAGGYLPGAYGRILETWGALDVLRKGWNASASPDSVPWTVERNYLVAARLLPNATFAQINSVSDGEQQGYLKLLGVDQPVGHVLAGNLALLHREIGSRFKSYTMAGSIHSITKEPDFYTARQDGKKLSTWVAALLEGKEVSDVGDSLLAKAR